MRGREKASRGLESCARKEGVELNAKIFATDIYLPAFERAGHGIYDKAIVNSLGPGLIERYFDAAGDHYVVKPQLRRLVVFSAHNLLKNPPTRSCSWGRAKPSTNSATNSASSTSIGASSTSCGTRDCANRCDCPRRCGVRNLPGRMKTTAMVTFAEITRAKEEARSRQRVESIGTMELYQERIRDLENELRLTEESLQTTIEEMETTNEELHATNEELMSANEELQSTNEELNSVNEELMSVSAEHQRKIDELVELTVDMDHLLKSTDIGVIYLDRDLRVLGSLRRSERHSTFSIRTSVGRSSISPHAFIIRN